MDTNSMEVPSKRQIARATLIALVAAAAIFVIAVLPAEYGIDPLHTGAALGLLSLAKSGPAPVSGAAADQPEVRTADQQAITVSKPATAGEAPIIKGVYVSQPGSYKVDSRVLTLGIGEGIEIKYHMQKGAGMVYSWTASKNVSYEFHGEPDVKPAGASDDYFESYEKNDDGDMRSHGQFTAPSTGIQGWYWENIADTPVTIKLLTSGFYDYILQNKDDVKTRLQPSDPK